MIVGMSGGVDSSVTAAILKERGYDVIGITMQLLPFEEQKQSACCNLGAVSDARRVCQKLGIPHYVINSRDIFKEKVIDPFVNTYKVGQTPNPCVECNRFIKFDELLKRADVLDAHYIATGHYCKITKARNSNTRYIKAANDQGKDQSYFLYMINQATLKRLMFPLGRYTKDQIREKANALGLLNANRPDSQEICFVSQNRIETLLRAELINPKFDQVTFNILMAPYLVNIQVFTTILLVSEKDSIFLIQHHYMCTKLMTKQIPLLLAVKMT